VAYQSQGAYQSQEGVAYQVVLQILGAYQWVGAYQDQVDDALEGASQAEEVLQCVVATYHAVAAY